MTTLIEELDELLGNFVEESDTNKKIDYVELICKNLKKQGYSNKEVKKTETELFLKI